MHLNRFIFTEILELIDVDWTGPSGGCQRFHFLPRFCRTLPDSGCKEVLSMNTVLSFLLKSAKPLVDESRLADIMACGESDWHAKVDNLRGMIVTNPGMVSYCPWACVGTNRSCCVLSVSTIEPAEDVQDV